MLTRTPGFLTDLFVTDVLITADQTTRTGAVFGQVKWTLTDRLSLTTGLRYTDETRSYVGGTTDTNPFGSSFLCFVTGACGLPPNPGQYVITSQNAAISDSNWSWRARPGLQAHRRYPGLRQHLARREERRLLQRHHHRQRGAGPVQARTAHRL